MKERGEVLKGKTLKIPTSCGNVYLTMNMLDKELGEIRIILGKSGNCATSLLERVSVFISSLLQHKETTADKIKLFQKHCKGTTCGNAFMYKGKKYLSCLDVVGELCVKSLKRKKPVRRKKPIKD